jgi:hypothetical protein
VFRDANGQHGDCDSVERDYPTCDPVLVHVHDGFDRAGAAVDAHHFTTFEACKLIRHGERNADDKQVNAGIVKSDERATLMRLVEIMIHIGLRFYQEKQEDGQPQMRLEP